MTKNTKVKSNHEYIVTFGVKQVENINKAANKVNETPRDFLKNATLESAKKIIDGSNIVKKNNT